MQDKDSPSVIAHINMLQGIISRMADNSAKCKTWMITILSAMLVLWADGKISKDALRLCCIPMSLFYFLDCLYLSQERKFIQLQREFVEKLNSGKLKDDDLFCVSLGTKTICDFIEDMLKGMFSFSTTPVYLLTILLIYLIAQ